MGRKLKKKTITLFIILCISPVCVYVYYMYFKFDYQYIAKTNSAWGAFGSYLGGILTPMFTLLSIYFIYYSIKQGDRNHNREMLFLNEQQSIYNVLSLAESINNKLNEKINFSTEYLKDNSIMIYSLDYLYDYKEWKARTNSKVKVKFKHVNADEFNSSLIDVLKKYNYTKDRNRDVILNIQYINMVMVCASDYLKTFEITVNYIYNIKETGLKNNALMLLGARINDFAITELYHLITDYIREQPSGQFMRNELYSFEEFVSKSVSITDMDNPFKAPCTQLLMMYLELLFSEWLDNNGKCLNFFSIGNDGKIEIHSEQQESEYYDISDISAPNNEMKPLLRSVCSIFSETIIRKMGRVGNNYPFEINVELIDLGGRFKINVKKISQPFLMGFWGVNISECNFFFSLSGIVFNLERIFIESE